MDRFLEKEIMPLLEEEGVEVLELSERGRARSPLFHIVVDRRDQEISIGDCAFLTRKLQRHLSEITSITGNWRVEISSPGIGYPLREKWQFHKNRGRLLKVTLSGEENTSEISGRLMTAHEAGIDIETSEGLEHFLYESILDAHVLPEIRSLSREGKKK